MAVPDIIRNFYESLAQKNDAWQKDLSEHVLFSDASKALYADGREAFIQSFSGFLRAVESVQLQQLITEGNHACAIVSYD